MALPNTNTQAYWQLNKFFSNIRDAQAPEKFTQQLLKDWWYKSSNQRPYIPLLKSLGFLSSEGAPTPRYLEYRDHSLSKIKMAEALKEAYSDIFLITEFPSSANKNIIQGKFKSYHNASDNVAKIHTATFFALLDLADLKGENISKSNPSESEKENSTKVEDSVKEKTPHVEITNRSNLGLHYNIQIHLPATKDVEVYNAIFKSINEHLID